MGAGSSHCGDLVGYFCGATVESGGLDILQLFLFSLDLLFLCNDENDSEHAHTRHIRGREEGRRV